MKRKKNLLNDETFSRRTRKIRREKSENFRSRRSRKSNKFLETKKKFHRSRLWGNFSARKTVRTVGLHNRRSGRTSFHHRRISSNVEENRSSRKNVLFVFLTKRNFFSKKLLTKRRPSIIFRGKIQSFSTRTRFSFPMVTTPAGFRREIVDLWPIFEEKFSVSSFFFASRNFSLFFFRFPERFYWKSSLW